MHRWIRTLGIIASGVVLWVTLAYGQSFTSSVLARLANLPSGAVFSWDSGDVTLTHSSNTLTLAGGVLVLPAGTAGAPPLAVGGATTGLFSSGAGNLTITNSGVAGHGFTATGHYLLSDSAVIYFGSAFDSSIARLGANVLDTGILTSLKNVTTMAGADTMTATEQKCSYITVTAAGTVTLLAATTVGQCFTAVATAAASVVSWDPASASDVIWLNGVALAGGNKASTDGTAGAGISCVNTLANVWRCYSFGPGVISDGGA
jgi:hypothetical protein